MRQRIPPLKNIYFYLSGVALEIGFGIFIILVGLLITGLVGSLR